MRTRGRPRYVGLNREQDAHALAALLEILAAGVVCLNSAVRWQTIESCQVLLRKTMAAPSIRRTRPR